MRLMKQNVHTKTITHDMFIVIKYIKKTMFNNISTEKIIFEKKKKKKHSSQAGD